MKIINQNLLNRPFNLRAQNAQKGSNLRQEKPIRHLAKLWAKFVSYVRYDSKRRGIKCCINATMYPMSPQMKCIVKKRGKICEVECRGIKRRVVGLNVTG